MKSPIVGQQKQPWILKILKLLIGLMMIVIFFGLLRLGFWQLDRADQKSQILAARALQKDSPPVIFSELDKLDKGDPLPFTVVHLKGKWLTKWRFFLDNRILDGALGYNLFTLFEDNSGRNIWVDRGWFAVTADRKFTDLIPSKGQKDIVGYIYYPDVYKVLATPELEKNHPIAIGGLNLPRFQRMMLNKGLKVSPFVVRQTFPEYEQGLVKKWHVVTMSPARHIGYAVQWFLLALTFALLNIIFYLKNSNKKRVL